MQWAITNKVETVVVAIAIRYPIARFSKDVANVFCGVAYSQRL
ncbi:hypothetical protein AM1_2513 [Acaryochloris marina MBIC11017]|uniref:Uncharacterized protein n=1 Tax=Acaryochloris marina (strain MBIC 11017) TaxID=329726 RepID=B0C5E5_ACAM1|nr:hypothetical protein AM1_2513 [Acaryochloris marina MBIC11017]